MAKRPRDDADAVTSPPAYAPFGDAEPRIRVQDDFASETECAEVVALARGLPGMGEAPLYGSLGCEYRSADACGALRRSAVLQSLAERAGELAGVAFMPNRDAALLACTAPKQERPHPQVHSPDEVDSEGFLLDPSSGRQLRPVEEGEEVGSAEPLLLNVHHDKNRDEARRVTVFLYLTDLPPGGGGHTFFPAVGNSGDSLAQWLGGLRRRGTHILHHSDIEDGDDPVVDGCLLGSEARARLLVREGSHETGAPPGLLREPDGAAGLAVEPRVGRAVCFWHDADDAAWHAPGVVFQGEKWLLTFFMAPPHDRMGKTKVAS